MWVFSTGSIRWSRTVEGMGAAEMVVIEAETAAQARAKCFHLPCSARPLS